MHSSITAQTPALSPSATVPFPTAESPMSQHVHAFSLWRVQNQARNALQQQTSAASGRHMHMAGESGASSGCIFQPLIPISQQDGDCYYPGRSQITLGLPALASCSPVCPLVGLQPH